MKKDFNPLAGILLEPPAKRFASLSERQLDELESERRSKKTKDVTNCHKMFWLCCATNRKRFSVYYQFIVCVSTQEATVHSATSFPGSTPLSRWRGGEDPGTHRYDTHADWSEDIDILTLIVIGRNCLPCKMADLCSYICYFLCN